ncbi:MAG: redoxin family protein [Shewanella sp.]
MNKHAVYVAPPLEVSEWLNCPQGLSLQDLRGKVVVIHAFQMLCPGCVSHGLPQTNNIHAMYSKDEVQVIGLHTVFEHHAVMTSQALHAFVHEYRLTFPIAIDRPSANSNLPCTMVSYQMQGTPTLIIIDKNGYVRVNYLGRMSDMQVGSIIGGLLEEQRAPATNATKNTGANKPTQSQCSDDQCPI